MSPAAVGSTSQNGAAGGVEPLLRVRGLVKHFPVGRGLLRSKRVVHAVNGVDLEVRVGETFALVGESGCGKTTTGRMVLGLETPTSGTLEVAGHDLATMRREERRALRRRVQVVFQDSNASLNPRKTLGQILATALTVSGAVPGGDRRRVRERVLALLGDVGLTPAQAFVDRLPHELSGGQRQRVGIARALAPDPDLVIADEPVSALDISVRAQILELLQRIQRVRGVTLLLISHDLSVVRTVAHRVGVMYLGRIIETGPVADVFERSIHPYSAALIDAAPRPDPRSEVRGRAHLTVSGDVPSAIDLPSGCAYHRRCPIAIDVCRVDVPALLPIPGGGAEGHLVACHRAAERVAGLPLPVAPPPAPPVTPPRVRRRVVADSATESQRAKDEEST